MSLQQDYANQSAEVAAKRAALHGLYEDADKATDAAKRDEVTSSIKSANLELNDLVDKLAITEDLVAKRDENARAMKAQRQPQNRQIVPENEDADEAFDEPAIKSVRQLVRQALEATGRKSGEGFRGFRGDLGEMAIKTLITSADLTPQNVRLPDIRLSVQEERTVADLMLQGTTSGQKVEYFEETTFTNAAAETAEADAKPESALDFTLREDSVRKIATWIPVTDEMLADVPAFESYLRERLGFMVKQREELQLLRGNGTAPNIQGILNRTGVGVVTGYGVSTIDSIYRAITKVRVDGMSEPTAGVFHPNDWQDVRLSKDSNGNYLLGPATDEGPARVWGLQVRATTQMLENTGLVGAFRPHAQVFRRSGIEIAISTENEDYFIKNKLAVRAEERLALAVYRPAAFCKVEALVQGS